MKSKNLSPQAAVAALIAQHEAATAALTAALERYFTTKKAPTSAERKKFCYPELRVTYETQGLQPRISRAYAKFQAPGVYSTTITQPHFFKSYLEEQLTHLARDYGAVIEVGASNQEIPYPYVLQSGNDLGAGGVSADALRSRPG